MIADFDKKQKREASANKIAFQIAGVLFLIIIIVLIIADFKMYQKRKNLISQIDSYKRQIEEIKNSNQNLKNDIANSNNTDYLEKIAYEQLGQQKPGEKEVIFINPPQKEETNQKIETSWSFESWFSWFPNTWKWIKGKF